MSLYLSGINYESIAESDGVSCVLFFSGCLHNCYGCQSPKTHNFSNGQKVTDDIIHKINNEINKRPFLSNLVLSGGDPMYSAKEIVEMIKKINIPKNNIWCYSGFKFEDIIKDYDMNILLNKCNVLVDGKFEIDKRDITLKFRGSSNQRVIDVQESLKENKVVLFT